MQITNPEGEEGDKIQHKGMMTNLLFQMKENNEAASCKVKIASAVRTAVVRDRQESERVCTTLVLKQRRDDINRCNEITQAVLILLEYFKGQGK